MSHVRQFIDDAVKGGFEVKNLLFNGEFLYVDEVSSKAMTLCDLLMNHEAWKAVGRSRKWDSYEKYKYLKYIEYRGELFRNPYRLEDRNTNENYDYAKPPDEQTDDLTVETKEKWLDYSKSIMSGSTVEEALQKIST